MAVTLGYTADDNTVYQIRVGRWVGAPFPGAEGAKVQIQQGRTRRIFITDVQVDANGKVTVDGTFEAGVLTKALYDAIPLNQAILPELLGEPLPAVKAGFTRRVTRKEGERLLAKALRGS